MAGRGVGGAERAGKGHAEEAHVLLGVVHILPVVLEAGGTAQVDRVAGVLVGKAAAAGDNLIFNFKSRTQKKKAKAKTKGGAF